MIYRVSQEIKKAKKSQNNVRVASLANYLVLLKLPQILRQPFTKFAVKANIQICNYASASKLDPSVVGFNQTAYHDKCTQCEAELTFGLATPQCLECKAKVKVCYGCLTVCKTSELCQTCHALLCPDCHEGEVCKCC